MINRIAIMAKDKICINNKMQIYLLLKRLAQSLFVAPYIFGIILLTYETTQQNMGLFVSMILNMIISPILLLVGMIRDSWLIFSVVLCMFLVLIALDIYSIVIDMDSNKLSFFKTHESKQL